MSTHPSATISATPNSASLPLIMDRAGARPEFSFDAAAELTRALKHGNEEAFTWLHRQWAGRINRYSFALAAGDEDFASEIAQAVWLRIARSLRVLESEDALWNWIAQAARHASIDLKRKGGRYRAALQRFADWLPKRQAENSETGMLTALEAALNQLNPDQRDLIERRYFSGESLETIAAEHSLTIRAVEGRLARLRRQLRKLIASEMRSQT